MTRCHEPDGTEWVLVLDEEMEGGRARINRWRAANDPDRRIDDRDIRVDQIRTADGKGWLRIWIRTELSPEATERSLP